MVLPEAVVVGVEVSLVSQRQLAPAPLLPLLVQVR